MFLITVQQPQISEFVACEAVVSVSFEPSGANTKDARGHWAKRSKKVGEGEGAGKERQRLPLNPDILPNAVCQRRGGNDVLPLVNRLSIKLVDQNDIRFPFIKDRNMAEAEENYFECPFDFEFALL